jgi:hypothetical protein
MVMCFECTAGKPSHSQWLSMSILRYNTLDNSSYWTDMQDYSRSQEEQCIWQCDAGYFRGINECVECSSSVNCPPGKEVQPCTDISDTSCEWDCVNLTKPVFFSEWVRGCEWGCVHGYVMKTIDYGMFVQYECVHNQTIMNFWEW